VRLVHPLEAKKRMPRRNETDTIDATGPAPAHDDIEEPHPRGVSPLQAV
jgi:hypothetical protein